jgi:hypothetical protein
MEHLRKLHRKNTFDLSHEAFNALLKTIGYKKWNVYAKKPFGGPQQVVEYLGRYTHKVAITHHRIDSVDNGKVLFRYKDYHDQNKTKQTSLSQEDFARRFEQHLLPKGFVKIRSYGFMKHHRKTQRINEIRGTLNLAPAAPKVRIPVRQRMLEKYGKDIARCQKCGKGTMVLRETIRVRYQPGKFVFETFTMNIHRQPDGYPP